MYLGFSSIRTGSWNPPSAPMIDSAPPQASHLPPESAYFLSTNRNKRSITVNFKTPEGLEIMHRLIRQSDVLVENFVSGKLSSFGLGWEDCQKINPRLIYASITGKSDSSTCPNLSSAGRRLWPDRSLPRSRRLRCSDRRRRYAPLKSTDTLPMTKFQAGLMHMYGFTIYYF
jgi:CoA-transferase family III